MKRCALFFSIGLLIVIIWGCQTPPPAPPQKPVPTPKLPGCALSVEALGTSLVSGMDWTNPVTGHSGVGQQSISIPESGPIRINVYAHPDISCATNLPSVCMVTWRCKTNQPVIQFWQLPSACNGFQRTVNTDCTTCALSVSQAIGFDCYIYKPPKALSK